MQSFIEGLPKVELHLHIEGTLEPELMFKLAERNRVQLSYKTIEEVRKAYQFNNLQTFLDIYYQGAQVLQNEQDFYDLAWAYFSKAHSQNVRHAEIFFDPQTHTARGIPFETVISGLRKAQEDAEQKTGLSSRLIMCFLRHLSPEEALDTLEEAKPFRKWITGVGLDSSEQGRPPALFQKVYEQAEAAGFLPVAHAGEEGPAEYVWEALQLLKSRRIDHGVRSTDDPELIQYLIREQIPLTVCPLSNIKLRVFQTMKEHNLRRMLQMGVCVTINSDDPAYFGGYMNENFLAAQRDLELTKDELVKLSANAIKASFIDENARQVLTAELNEYYRKNV
ncbi:MAG: adenosine deaminase [Anaerolineae bacterium]|nr:adenosine deaminase [Anaerolineae bacterium]